MVPALPTSPRVLVVDDEAPIRTFLKRALERFPLNVTVEEAATVEEAVGKIHDTEYDVVITDYRLGPEKTGIDVLREAARAQPAGGRIMLTGYHEADIAVQAINEGRVHRYLEKPLDLETFQRTLAQVLLETESVHQRAQAALKPAGGGAKFADPDAAS